MLKTLGSGLLSASRRASHALTRKPCAQSVIHPLEAKQLVSIRLFTSSQLLPRSAAPEVGGGTKGQDLVAEYEHVTGLEKEEIEAQLAGTSRFALAPPRGPFGTKDAPAVVESQFDERIVGCSGGQGEEEHDVVWFKLRKEVGFECPVCTQVFELKVIGAGGLPGAHH